MLRHLGVDVQADGSRLILNPKPFQPFEASEWVVPGDFSSAAFFIVAGLLIQGSQLVIRNVGLNPYRTGLMTVLQSVGGKITIENERLVGGEPIGDLVVTGSEMVGDIELSEDDIPGLIDEVPILTIAGLYLNGTLTVRGAEELRKKESDRIEAMAVELRKLGIDMETYPDGFRLQGNPDRTIAAPSQPLYAHHDHRIAMAFGILNRIADPEAVWTMDGREWVSISFPTFFDCLTQLSR
jgi:3-phosphoshikimate 1-carboxyvinyltransferase